MAAPWPRASPCPDRAQRASAEDAAEDEKYGKGSSGDDLPAELARRESRLAKLQAAKAELEAKARQQ